MDIKSIAKEMETIITKEELIEKFQQNKIQAGIAIQTAKECEKYPCERHESGSSKFAYYLGLYYGFKFENETIAKVLRDMGHGEFAEELGLLH